MKAMIFAAGLGSRLKPWTDHHPKALAPVNGKSLLERNIRYLQQHGIFEVVVNVHHFADQIVAAVAQNQGWGSQVSISDETDAVLETGGGLLKAAPFFAASTEPFVVMNADILTNFDLTRLVTAHQKAAQEHQALASLAVMQRESSRCFWVAETGRLMGWERLPKRDDPGQRRPEGLDVKGLQRKAFSGIQIIDPRLLQLIRFSGKFSMIDVYLDLCSQHWIHTLDHSGDLLLDVGKPESLEKAAQFFRL